MLFAVGFVAAIVCGSIGATRELTRENGLAILLNASLAITASAGLIGNLRHGHVVHWLAGGFIASWPLSWGYCVMRAAMSE